MTRSELALVLLGGTFDRLAVRRGGWIHAKEESGEEKRRREPSRLVAERGGGEEVNEVQ